MDQQYSIKKVKKLFEDKASVVVVRELNQINDFETYKPIKDGDLSWEKKEKTLESLTFVTEKRNSNIKARKVADGSKQRTYDG